MLWGLEKNMMIPFYDKIGPAGVVIAVLSFISLHFFLASVIYLAWVPVGFKTFLAALKKDEPPVTEELAKKNALSTVVWTALVHKTPRAELQGEVQYLFQRNFGKAYV